LTDPDPISSCFAAAGNEATPHFLHGNSAFFHSIVIVIASWPKPLLPGKQRSRHNKP
jgi:hypothetical protein